MNIAKYAVTRPVAVTMQIAALVLLGVICFTRLPVDLLPKVTLPTMNVSTQWPNVAPEEMEAQITRPMEQALSAVPNLYQITSSTSAGSSSVRVQFQWGTDIGQAMVDVLQLVERAKRRFPDDPTLQTPVVSKFDPNQMPILRFGVTGEKDLVKLRSILVNQISPMVESADGVAAASVNGGRSRAIILNVDPVRLHAYHLSMSDIMRRLVQENVNSPAGIAKQSNTEYTIRSQGWLASLDELRAIPLTAPNGQIVKLADVADVDDAYQEVRSYVRINGEPAAGLTITKQSDANTVTTVKSVMERLELAKKMYPNLKFTVSSDQSVYIQNSINDVKTNTIIGGVLAVLILLFFLRNIRSTLVVALSIPISIISTFALLYLSGFTLNTMSLSGLALATGLIVDDAVVVLENIFRHIERDKLSSHDASISGTNEIMSAVIASTWTVMVVFLPLLLIKGQSGQMFTQFALVVIFSLAVSLLVAATIVPMLATRFISGEAHVEALKNGHGSANALAKVFSRFGAWFNGLDNSYREGLRWALRHRWWTVGGALAITASTFLLAPLLGTDMMPQTDSGDFSVSFKLPQGTALDKTDSVTRKIEQMLMKNPDVASTFASDGGNQGSVNVRLKGERTKTTQEVMADLKQPLAGLPGVRPRLSQFDMVSNLMTGGNQSVEVDIFGNDLTTLSRISKDVMGRMREVPGLDNPDVNWQEAMPEIQWKVDRVKAAQLGLSFSDIAGTINAATNGSIATYYQDGGYQYPIVVQLPPKDRRTVDAMSNLVVTNNAGREVVLSEVAVPIYANGPNQITRQDRQRFIAVSGNPQGRPIGDIKADVEKALTGLQLPPGYYWNWGTAQKRQAEEFAGMGLAVVLAICIIYMLLAAQFESFTHPLTILLSVPLASTGVILSLFLTGRSYGLTAFIGVLMLVGIVVKNGILLVDYTNTLRKRGIERNEAVLIASPTRLRPILMTASAAMLGMLPIALGIGEGSEIQAPMATVVIGGLLTSTFLTLFVVPIVYTLLDDITGKRQRNMAQLAEVETDAPAMQE